MPQIRKKNANMARSLAEFAFPEYTELSEYRERVDDCLQGQRNIKRKRKYLPPTKWQEEHPDEYAAYLRRALFYSLTAYAVRLYEGLCLAGSPNIVLPQDHRLDFIAKKATVHKRDLHSLQGNLNREQLAHGLRCMLLQPTDDPSCPFVIQEATAGSFLVSSFDTDDRTGESKARLILLDNSRNVFDRKTKQYEYKQELLLLALDGNGQYYQCVLKPEEWAKFDTDNPPKRTAKYPALWGRRLDRIPFTWCGATTLSGVTFDIPPLLDMCDCELKLFELDAMYAQHLFQSSQETVFFLHAPPNFKLEDVRYGAGAQNKLPGDMDVKVISNNGVGFDAQKQYMDSIMEQIELRRMSIMSSKSHQSGTAVGIVQNAQTSPLRTVINTSGDAITEQLRFMAQWMGYKEEEVQKIIYTPSQAFAHADSNLSEFVSLSQAVAAGEVKMLEKDLFRMAIENGYIHTKQEWPEYLKEWKLEQLARTNALGVLPVGGRLGSVVPEGTVAPLP